MSLKRKQPDFEPYEDGSYTQKVKGKQPSKQRPDFDESKYDLSGLGKKPTHHWTSFSVFCNGLKMQNCLEHRGKKKQKLVEVPYMTFCLSRRYFILLSHKLAIVTSTVFAICSKANLLRSKTTRIFSSN